MSGCEHCGGVVHIRPYNCRYDLHGEEDWMKSSCAYCGERIPSGAPRAGDKFGNLYCDRECMAEGMAELFERIAGGDDRATA